MTITNTRWKRKQGNRASVPEAKGSITIEASLTIPVFLFAVLCLVYLIEIQIIQTTVYAAALNAAKVCTQDTAVISILNPMKLESEMVEFIGKDRLENSIISGGSKGLHCATSYVSPESKILNIVVRYQMQLPFPKFMNLTVKCREEFRLSSWNGYVKPQMQSEDDSLVYITKNGIVYHEDYQCSHLQLSVRFIAYGEVSGLRNEYGGKYYKCEKCVHGDVLAGVYISDSGNRYHGSLNCSGIKRTIYTVPKSQVFGRRGCLRCVK